MRLYNTILECTALDIDTALDVILHTYILMRTMQLAHLDEAASLSTICYIHTQHPKTAQHCHSDSTLLS